MSSAVKVWGHADQYNLILRQVEGGDWQASVPADLTDGQYACEFWAENAAAEQTYWSGVLYMQNSRLVCVCLEEDPYRVILLSERVQAELMDDRYLVTIKKGCCCATSV